MKLKLTCKECKRTCCNNVRIIRREGYDGLDPTDAKSGDWFYTRGITLVKKKNGLWKCRAFDSKKRLCRMWSYRPPICRDFFCAWAIRKRRKLPLNFHDALSDNYYIEIKTSYAELKKGIKKRIGL